MGLKGIILIVAIRVTRSKVCDIHLSVRLEMVFSDVVCLKTRNKNDCLTACQWHKRPKYPIVAFK